MAIRRECTRHENFAWKIHRQPRANKTAVGLKLDIFSNTPYKVILINVPKQRAPNSNRTAKLSCLCNL